MSEFIKLCIWTMVSLKGAPTIMSQNGGMPIHVRVHSYFCMQVAMVTYNINRKETGKLSLSLWYVTMATISLVEFLSSIPLLRYSPRHGTAPWGNSFHWDYSERNLIFLFLKQKHFLEKFNHIFGFNNILLLLFFGMIFLKINVNKYRL